MSTITTKDGTQIYYRDWGTGQPVVFSHGGRSARTPGKTRWCSWAPTATHKDQVNADLLAFLKA